MGNRRDGPITEDRVLETVCEGVAGGEPDPCLMVIFGASGDLAGADLVPSLLELATKSLLPEDFAVLGAARTGWDDDAFRDEMRVKCEEECDFDEEAWEWLSRRLHYMKADLKDDEAYRRLEERLGRLRYEHDLPENVFFHLALPPSFFGTIAAKLGEHGLAHSENGWRRLVIEKPFGHDRDSARELDRAIRSVFHEDQIYRIDHYLGKETVQNMLVFRFANPAFEPIWNRDYIDHVQITASEDSGIGTRAGFYEDTGALRDMIQNHLLQLLCMTAVDPPVRFDGDSVRDETVKVLRSIRTPRPGSGSGSAEAVRGQYGPGTMEGEKVRGYRQEENVDEDSTTETFAAVKLELESWRWTGVPFYLRTGKRLPAKRTEVAVQFKPTPHMMFPLEERRPSLRNVLVFRLQPKEGILQTFVAKQPGPDLCLTPVTSRFLYADAFGVTSPPRAYGWLILDVMEGDQTLFARADWIDLAWSIVDPIAEHWREKPPKDFPNYEAGTWGPEATNALIRADGRRWREGEVN